VNPRKRGSRHSPAAQTGGHPLTPHTSHHAMGATPPEPPAGCQGRSALIGERRCLDPGHGRRLGSVTCGAHLCASGTIETLLARCRVCGSVSAARRRGAFRVGVRGHRGDIRCRRRRRTSVAHPDGEALQRALWNRRRIKGLHYRQVDVNQDVDRVVVAVHDVVTGIAWIALRRFGCHGHDVRDPVVVVESAVSVGLWNRRVDNKDSPHIDELAIDSATPRKRPAQQARPPITLNRAPMPTDKQTSPR